MTLHNPVSDVAGAALATKKTGETISADVVAKITKQCPSWTVERLATCTIVRDHHSSFPECKSEIQILGPAGNVVVKGRDFRTGPSFFWDA